MKKQLAGISAAAVALLAPAITFAQTAQYNSGIVNSFRNLLSPVIPTGQGLGLVDLAVKVLQFLTLLAGIIAIFYLIWAGIQYITAGGDDDKAKKARAGIFNAVIGIVVIIFAYAIIVYVSSIARSGNDLLQGNDSGLFGTGTSSSGIDPNAILQQQGF